MEAPALRKVTARLDRTNVHSVSRPNPSRSRPPSPFGSSQTSLSPPPIFKPKAKLSSSATVRRIPSTSSLTNGNRSVHVALSAPSRPASPSSPPSSPSVQSLTVKTRVTARPASKSITAHSNAPAHSVGGAKESSLPARPRGSTGSSTIQTTLSTVSFQVSSSPQPSPLSERSLTSESEASLNKPLKIKAKVSGVVKSIPSAVEPTSPQLPWVTTRPVAQHRTRTPSVASAFSQKAPARSRTPEVLYYPITTSVPAANPHRFPPPRSTPHSPHRYQSFTTRDNDALSNTSLTGTKGEINSMPLPPLSPPTSALSLSSRSSLSRSSISYKTDGSEGSKASTSTVGSRTNDDHASGLVSPLPGSSGEQDITLVNDYRNPSKDSSDVDSEGSEHKARAEAKTNRKIADLEITNRSLLAINTTLESTKHRQAKEIRDLRRKLREARLALSPKQFKAMKTEDREDEESHEDEESDSEEEDYSGEQDEMFLRVKSLVEGLVASGKEALEKRPTDFSERGTTRVLHADELCHWRDSSGRSARSDVMSQVGTDDLDDDVTTRMPSSHSNVLDTDHELTSEDEAEAPHTDSGAPHHYAQLPPITVTSPS